MDTLKLVHVWVPEHHPPDGFNYNVVFRGDVALP